MAKQVYYGGVPESIVDDALFIKLLPKIHQK